MNFKRFIPGNFSKPASDQVEKKSVPTDAKSAAAPATSNPEAKNSATRPTTSPPAAAVSPASAKIEDKPDFKAPREDIPDVKTLKIDRSVAQQREKSDSPPMKPDVKSEPAKSAGDAVAKTTESDPEKKTESSNPVVKDAKKSEPESTLIVAKSEVPTKEAAKQTLLLDAPKAAQFQNLPATDDWCPKEIAEHYPELRAHIYEDNAATERVLPGGWRVVGATKRGRQHAHKATHREDAIAFNIGAQFTILAVSDGAGSCPLSRIGSHVASRTVTARLMEALPKLDKAVTDEVDKLKAELSAQLTAALVAACQALQDIAAKSKTSVKDYRCTLLTLLHWRGEKHELLLANQIGDGAILVLNKDKSTRRIGEADSGQFSGEVSCFVPDDNARDKAKRIDFITPVEAVECVLLCTDGIEDPFFPIAKKAEDLFRQLYNGVTEPLKDFKSQPAQPPILPQESAAGALGQWLEFEKRGENDDRSVLVLHRRPPTVTYQP